MKKAITPRQPARSDRAAAEALDSLNAQVRQHGARETQRHIEGRLEEQARRRRAAEKPASSGLKKT
ncbi:MAG TPA: hypothetical protein VFZ59_10885 [Verrucomicrobiae bacterium]|nr:hypothetical protein [Verrucomicrobiae bacterium]